MSLSSFQSRTTDYSNKCLLILRQDNISERDGRSSMCLFVCSQSLLFGSTTTSQIKKQLISLIRPISLTLISQSQMETFIEYFFFFATALVEVSIIQLVFGLLLRFACPSQSHSTMTTELLTDKSSVHWKLKKGENAVMQSKGKSKPSLHDHFWSTQPGLCYQPWLHFRINRGNSQKEHLGGSPTGSSPGIFSWAL